MNIVITIICNDYTHAWRRLWSWFLYFFWSKIVLHDLPSAPLKKKRKDKPLPFVEKKRTQPTYMPPKPGRKPGSGRPPGSKNKPLPKEERAECITHAWTTVMEPLYTDKRLLGHYVVDQCMH